MFGGTPTSIIIVYPKGYYEIASKLKHEISKSDSLDSTIWSTDQYRDNIPTLSGKSHVVFIGDENENEFVKPYYSSMGTIFLRNGGCYGFDGTKAVVFGLDNAGLRELTNSRPKNYLSPDNEPLDFQQEIFGLLDVPAQNQDDGTGNRFSRFTRGALAKASEISVLTEEKLKASALRKERSYTAISAFLEKGIDDWLSVDRGR